jgi:hypothetical protein
VLYFSVMVFQKVCLCPESRNINFLGQFHEVALAEVRALRQACEMLDPDYCPPVTFIIVNKRHKTRMNLFAHIYDHVS